MITKKKRVLIALDYNPTAQKVIVGEIENERYAEIAKRDLELAGSNANIINNDNDIFMFFSDEAQLAIPDTQVEKTKRILDIKFV